jgi:hypothetical protein
VTARIVEAACAAGMLVLVACSQAAIDTDTTAADQAVASAQPTIAMACWLAQAADAGFQVYAASAKADATVIADEAKAMAGVNAICAAPPGNVAQAVAAVIAAYKAIVAATPQPPPAAPA